MTVISVRLKDLIRVHYGKALKKAERIESGPHSVFGSRGEVGKHSDRLVDYPTLIVGRKGSVGAVSYAPDGGWPIDTAFYVERLEPDELDLRYLFYALRRCRLEERVITTSIPGLSRDDIYSAKIPLPPLPEQRRIAAILDKADAVRRKRQQTLDLADQFLRSAFLDLFGDPVTNPKGWPSERLDSHCAVLTGFAFKSSDFNRESQGVQVIRIQDLGNNDNAQPVYWSHDYGSRYLVGSGDLLVSLSGSFKVHRWTGATALLNQRIALLKRQNGKPASDWIEHLLRLTIEQLGRTATETSIKNVSVPTLRQWPCPTPPSTARDDFARLVRRQSRAQAVYSKTHDCSANCFASLTQRAFRGELS